MDEYDPRLKSFARSLRAHQTEAEAKLWIHLRRDHLGVRFYRQRPLGRYILDFYAPKAKLVIELDGSQHQDDPTTRERDQLRDAWLRAQGLKVLRFDDRQALTESQAVIEVIIREVEAACLGDIAPRPPLQRGESSESPAERSLPFVKGGQEGFKDTRQPDPAQD
jgi:very-short-patch-repair endonuclease